MPLDRALLIKASEGLLSAAAVGTSWELALDSMARAAHSHSLCIWSSRKGRTAFLGNETFAREGVAQINKPGDPPYTDEHHISSKKDDGFVQLLTHPLRPRIERLPFYQDVLKKIDFANFAGYSMDPDDGSLLKVAFWRSYAEGGFDEDQIHAMNSILSNVRYAILFSQKKNELLSHHTATPFILRGDATFKVDSSGRITPFSIAAERLMIDMPLAIVRGKLVGFTDGETRRLERAIGEAVKHDVRPGSVVLSSSAGHRYQLIILPLHGDALDIFSDTRAIATIIRIDGEGGERDTSPTCRILQRAFDLTSREAEVAALVGQGLAPLAIAQKLGIGEGTVRNYVKVVFKKIGVGSQIQLCGLIARYH